MAYAPVTVLNGNSAAVSMGAFQDANSVNYPAMVLDNQRATYRATASFTPQATAAVALFNIQGSATKTIRVTKVLVGGASTALSIAPILQLHKVSALGAGGTGVAPTIGLLDSTAAPPTAVVTHYTTTLKATGTAIDGPLCTVRLFTDTVTTPTVASRHQTMLWPEGGVVNQCVVLRGTSQYLECKNINAGNLAAGTVLEYSIEWVEDAS